MTTFEENVIWHLVPVNPRIKDLFLNPGLGTLFTLLTPNLMHSFRKN